MKYYICVLFLLLQIDCRFIVSVAYAADLGDNDRDGVINARDKCPDTKPLLKVDRYGCQQLTFVTQQIMLDIPFKYGSAYIHPKYYPEIEKIAQKLVYYKEARLMLEGHSSVEGSEQVNKKMSLERAIRVANVLISEFDIAPTRITVTAVAEKRIAVPDNTEQAQQVNRRVFAYIRRQVVATHSDYLN